MKKNIVGLIVGMALIIGGVYSNHTHGAVIVIIPEVSSSLKIDGMHDFLDAIELELDSGDPVNIAVATGILDELYAFFTEELPGAALSQLLEEGG